jgi:hypothetical protein
VAARLRSVVAGLAAAGSLVAGAGIAQAETGSVAGGGAGAECTTVWQYRVTSDGDMTDAESNGSFVGWAITGDTFNVRIQGNPRYYGANVNNGKWGWILASRLDYTGTTWCE